MLSDATDGIGRFICCLPTFIGLFPSLKQLSRFVAGKSSVIGK